VLAFNLSVVFLEREQLVIVLRKKLPRKRAELGEDVAGLFIYIWWKFVRIDIM
jgi:hypothetical protein